MSEDKGKPGVWLMVGFLISDLSLRVLATVPYMIVLWIAALGAIALAVIGISSELGKPLQNGRWVLTGVVVGAVIRVVVIGMFSIR